MRARQKQSAGMGDRTQELKIPIAPQASDRMRARQKQSAGTGYRTQELKIPIAAQALLQASDRMRARQNQSAGTGDRTQELKIPIAAQVQCSTDTPRQLLIYNARYINYFKALLQGSDRMRARQKQSAGTGDRTQELKIPIAAQKMIKMEVITYYNISTAESTSSPDNSTPVSTVSLFVTAVLGVLTFLANAVDIAIILKRRFVRKVNVNIFTFYLAIADISLIDTETVSISESLRQTLDGITELKHHGKRDDVTNNKENVKSLGVSGNEVIESKYLPEC
ncbi:hypothetical protein BSL78_11188 [Apostichopus japonicus]|uniref:Uncharacterized protein n=1 Tax=Stichopus japonicus TaxID=307972 RepID=A0A2G8KV95_STIJA|nr:hypothetical protein BSL78_11188 [Apostichopus japonicus]